MSFAEWFLEAFLDRDDDETEAMIRSGKMVSGDHPLSPEERQAEADRFAHNARIRKQIRELERRLVGSVVAPCRYERRDGIQL